MRYARYVLVVLSLFLLNSCKEDGFATMPELSAKVFEALKAQDFAGLIALVPQKKDIKLAVKLYQGGTYTQHEWEQMAESKQEAILLQMDIDYKKLTTALAGKGFDIKHAVLKDTRYQGNQTIDNYNVSTVELIIESGGAQCIIVYNALTIGNRWFMDKGLTVKDVMN